MKRIILIVSLLILTQSLFSHPAIYDISDLIVSARENELFTIKADLSVSPWNYQRWIPHSYKSEFELVKEEFVPATGVGMRGTQFWTFKVKVSPYGFWTWKAGIFFSRDVGINRQHQKRGIRVCISRF